MHPAFQDNIDFMHALYAVIETLGKREQFEPIVSPGATSCNYVLSCWAELIRSHFIAAATHQCEVGRTDVLLVPEGDVLISIKEQRCSKAAHRPLPERLVDREACLHALNAFLCNREAAKAAFIQATYLALRDEPEHLYLACTADGTWCTLQESDLKVRVRWQYNSPNPTRPCLTFQLETVTAQRKLLYSDLFEEANGDSSNYVTDQRTLPQIAQELGHSVHEFIEHEVGWHLDELLTHMRDLKFWNVHYHGENEQGEDDQGMCGAL